VKQYKRRGKDSDDLYFLYGKIHGLENIAFVDDEVLQRCNDPISLQKAINEVKIENEPALSEE